MNFVGKTLLKLNFIIYRSMLMTASDISAITKPWKVQHRVCFHITNPVIARLQLSTFPHSFPLWTFITQLFYF